MPEAMCSHCSARLVSPWQVATNLAAEKMVAEEEEFDVSHDVPSVGGAQVKL